MLIYYFELKKVAFWFIDFQQPSLGDIQIPMGLCSLPSGGFARPPRRIIFSRKGAETCLPSGGFATWRLCEHTLFFEN
jgi:hypothetical protein